MKQDGNQILLVESNISNGLVQEERRVASIRKLCLKELFRPKGNQ